MINNALGNFELLVICGLCKLSPQCKPIHVTHRQVLQVGGHDPMLQRGRGFRPFGIAPCGSLKCRCANRCEKDRFPSCDEAQNSYAESATSPRHCNPARRYRKAGLFINGQRSDRRGQGQLVDRFHESCHKRGIHRSFQTPICAVRGALSERIGPKWQRGGERLNCRSKMRMWRD